MTQDLYQKAMKFAGEKHANQLVPGTNANYLLHISNVTMEVILAHATSPDFDLDLAVQLAILHDSIEDTDATFEELAREFGEDVANGVQALTKDDSLPNKDAKMADSLRRINLVQKEVGIVKLADRITNMQAPPAFWDTKKRTSYRNQAEMILEALSDKNDYFEKRLAQKIREYQQYIDS